MNLQYKYYASYYKEVVEDENEIKDIEKELKAIDIKGDKKAIKKKKERQDKLRKKYTGEHFVSANSIYIPNYLNNNSSEIKEIVEINNIQNELVNLDAYKSFVMKTTYPGLVIGGGYVHEVPDCEEAFKLGFSLDYVTGMPYIPSSSVKGVLRAAFKNHDYMKEILTSSDNEVTDKIIRAVEFDIFGPDEGDSCQGKDTFLDGLIVSNKASEQAIFADDYITKHKGLKNPIPVKFMKIRPDVHVLFRFLLSSTEIKVEDKENKIIDVQISATDKASIFNQILKDFGIGARRNVGYGNLKSVNLYFDNKSKKNKQMDIKSMYVLTYKEEENE